MRGRFASLAILIFVTIFTFGFFADRASAQIDPLVTDNVKVRVTPSTPGPNEDTTISLSSFIMNLDSADITWEQDGQKVLQGIGKKTLVVKTGDVGSTTTIKIQVMPVTGLPSIMTVTIRPQLVDLLWQAKESITPPLYRGKTLATKESKITFVAVPQFKDANGNFLSQDNLMYSWKRDHEDNPSLTGYDKTSFETPMTYMDSDVNAGVEVTSLDGNVVADKEQYFTPYDPKVLWYSISPLYGPQFDHALKDGYPVTGNNVSLIAEPYFMSPKTNKFMKYEWTVNGSTLKTPKIPNTLILQRNDNSKGSATVSLHLTNVATLFQEITSSLSLNLQ